MLDAACLSTSAPSRSGEAARRAIRPLLAAVSGLIAYAAAPPHDLSLLAFVSSVPLLIAIHGTTPGRAFRLGALTGLVFNLCLGAWLYRTIQVFGGQGPLACLALTLVVCAYHGARTGLLAWLVVRAQRRGLGPGLALALATAATEVAYPVLFPWYGGASVHSVPVLIQLAEIGGPILVSVALTGSNVALAEIAWAKLDGRAPSRARVALGAMMPIAMVAYGLVRIPMIDAASSEAPKLHVGVVQGNSPHVGKSIRGALRAHRDESASLRAQHDLDLLVWPETALPTTLDHDRWEIDARHAVYGDSPLRAPVLTGAVVRRGAQEHNAALLVSPGERAGGITFKNVLVPIGEHIPWADRFPQLHAWIPNAGRLSPGTRVDPLVLDGHPIAALVCYEDVIPSFARRAVAETAPELLVTLSNDVWFGRSSEPLLHLALAKFRAVEHRRALVRATNSGPSSFVDPVGRSLLETPLFERAARASEVPLLKRTTPYELLGDVPWWCAAVLLLARRRPPHSR